MARGRKIALSLDEQLVKVTEEIAATKSHIKELESEKKQLEEKIHQAQLSQINKLMIEKGMSFEDLKKVLEKYYALNKDTWIGVFIYSLLFYPI